MLENIVWAPRYSLSMLEKWLKTVSLSDEFRPISDGFRLWIKAGSAQTALVLLWVAGHPVYSTGMEYRTHCNHQIRDLSPNCPKPEIIPPLDRVLISPHSYLNHLLNFCQFVSNVPAHLEHWTQGWICNQLPDPSVLSCLSSSRAL